MAKTTDYKISPVGRIYYKPLIPVDTMRGLDPEAILKRLRTDVLRRFKKNLLQTTFSEAAKKALRKAVEVKVDMSSILITARHPAYGPLVQGQRKGQMKWLRKAKRPIPIITETGKLIFRTASAKSMKSGKWIHPGRQPSDAMERARADARDFIKKSVAKELLKQIKKSLTGRR